MCPRCNEDIEDWEHIWVCEANEFEIDELIRKSIYEFELKLQKEVMDQQSQVLIGKKRFWELLRGVYNEKCEVVAELEKERGLEKRDLRKRKESPTKDDDDGIEIESNNKNKKTDEKEK
ncbi:hypothetical protein GLOIN_2v1781566 [Rhizophagus irregularis DAOM 181602=DAOM 197198]|uniref:Uncharacterized protein n=1 Tax=Rhizophagus irregularis (strain DAOM 181602 / DAOM 197198 / MUCL 43194) TaxID=747089 RepID=A0A2P4PJP1_RHIID|nr:hypothetical protein GLOIN_2v1781566 [Rhizophagus irregularis DAOM 181602=DAOM 197198]POG65603.1 hypothetical protein GLOIN_2v1781566 [Rhizophagus irregularis DAOM 181602=DAOM 197198]|eukprot:XP_025172469.1 hypothetical protein GLOIN_2v1781566 [Rhizophagus irregularis DAOM 181602=DAOM 197198]